MNGNRQFQIITQKVEDIFEQRLPIYRVLSFDLNKPRIDEPQNFTGEVISVIEAIPDNIEFVVKINHYENDKIPLRLGRSITIPFIRFFLTTPRHPGGKIKLIIGAKVFKFENLDLIHTFTNIFTLSRNLNLTVANSITLDTAGRQTLEVWAESTAPTTFRLDVSGDGVGWIENYETWVAVTSVKAGYMNAWRHIRLRSDAAGVTGDLVSLALTAGR